MTEREQMVANLIREHVAIGYKLRPDGSIDPESLFLGAEGAAHVIVHALERYAAR